MLEKIASFTVNHLNLLTGIYISRTDLLGNEIYTTYDIRMTRPNVEPVLDTAAVHALEHLGGAFLRNHKKYKERVIYFGPMGCRTGFYLLLNGKETPKTVAVLLKEMFDFIMDFEGEIPGATPKDCGNYLDMNLSMAKYYAHKYLNEVIGDLREERFNYPT